jgi:hypothetical protein
MGRPISIGVASDTREFSSGIKRGVIEPLEDAADSLDDVQRKGDQAGTELVGAFKKAQQEVSDFKREQAEAARELGQKWKGAGADLGDGIRKGAHDADEGVKTLKENVGANAKEMAASFDGSVSGMAGGLQGLVAEMTEGFGPAGLAAGVLAAAGIGLVQTALEGGQEDAAAFKERVADLTAEFIKTGKAGGTSVDFLADKLQQMATETEDGKTSLGDLYKLVRTAGEGSFRSIAQAYAGNSKDLDKLVAGQQRHLDALRATEEVRQQSEFGYTHTRSELSKQVDAQQEVVDKLNDAKRAAHEAAIEQAAYAASGAAELQRKAELIDAAKEAQEGAKQSALDSMSPMEAITEATGHAEEAERLRAQATADGTKDSSDDWTDFAKSVHASADEILTAFEGQITAMEQWNTNSATVRQKYGDATLKFFTDMGPSGKAALQTALDTWTGTDWTRLQNDSARQMAAAGAAGATAYDQSLRGGIPSSVTGPRVVHVGGLHRGGLATSPTSAVTRRPCLCL